MKLTGRDAVGFFEKPDPRRAGLLIFGPDAMRTARRRQQVISGLIGEAGEEEMRLTRMSGGDLRKDPARLLDALKAQSFFP
ncbi:MAG: DNA polymerase III subunit delta, partial [Alphaproteobacteria bacterium]|nr:DNA polymerase III subunit delta [Alphaproteobacteria bacterium]